MSHIRREDVTIPEFGTRLKKALSDKRISQRELSRRINVSYSLIGSYINDKKYPSLETLILICRTLKITPDYLLEFSEYPNTKSLYDDAYENGYDEGHNEGYKKAIKDFMVKK